MHVVVVISGNWLREPLCDLERINQRLDILEAFNEAGEFRDSMHRDLLRRVSNLTKLSRKLMSKKASLDDCYKIYVCILALESIVDKLTGLEDCCQAVRDLISVCLFGLYCDSAVLLGSTEAVTASIG